MFFNPIFGKLYGLEKNTVFFPLFIEIRGECRNFNKVFYALLCRLIPLIFNLFEDFSLSSVHILDYYGILMEQIFKLQAKFLSRIVLKVTAD